MSDETLNDLEAEFRQEEKGPGSLSPHVADGSEKSYVGYDIHPENIEALFFEGIGVPRWDSIKADSVEQQEVLYMAEYTDVMAKYPMIARANDTFQHVEYTAAEVTQLLEECGRILAGSSDPKVVKAVQKFALAGEKAAEKNAGSKYESASAMTMARIRQLPKTSAPNTPWSDRRRCNSA